MRATARRDLPWGLLLAAAASWGLLAAWSGSSPGRWLKHDYQPDALPDQLAAVVIYAGGWALMTLAMMVSAATALLAAFRPVAQRRQHPDFLAGLVVLGFLAVWVATGCAFRALDSGLHAAVEAVPWLSARPELIAASGLLVAGAFQFSATKRRCLTACRSPGSFVRAQWGRGTAQRDAFAAGASFGLSCVGCCWALMLVMFASSMASFVLMAALTAVMAAERARRVGDVAVRTVGAALLAAAVVVAL